MNNEEKSSTSISRFRKKRPKDSISESTFRIRKEEGLIREVKGLMFDKALIHNDPNAEDFAKSILHGQKKRRDKKKFTRCAQALIANFHRLDVSNTKSLWFNPLTVPLNKNLYINLSKQGLGHISGTYLSVILSYLDENNYIEKVIGFYDRDNSGKRSKVTRVWLKPKLELVLRKCSPLNIQLILQQTPLIKMSEEDKDGKKVFSYPEKPRNIIDPMRVNLEKINQVNQSSCIGIGYDQVLFAFMERIEKDLGILVGYDQDDISYLVEDYFPMYRDSDNREKPIEYPYCFLDLQNRRLHIHTYKEISISDSIEIHCPEQDYKKLTITHSGHTFSITKSLKLEDIEKKQVNASKIHSLVQRFMKYLHLKDDSGQIDLVSYVAYSRNFSRGSFDCGGRYYGSEIVAMPKQIRKFLKINGETTVELDFKSMHLRILYQKKGHTDLSEDLYGDSNKFPRLLIKMAVNMLLNANDVMAAKRALFNDEKCICPWAECVEVVDWVLDSHIIIKEYLGSDMGVRLQRLDSDIAERVMLHFANLGEACFGVHDSFIVREGLENQLRQVMYDSYVSIIDAEPVIE